MAKVRGLKCRECGRGYPVAPLHVCEFCLGPLEVDYHYEEIRRPGHARPDRRRAAEHLAVQS
jgi:threonine synthase